MGFDKETGIYSGGFYGADPLPSTQKVSRAGRKPDQAKWQAFYFAVIELAKQGQLTRERFDSSAALSEEILTMMGVGAFSADYIKPVVSQIYKRFV